MKLKNSALQELYDTLTTGTFVFTPSGTDPIDEAFRECDEKLPGSVTFATIKNLQDRNDILEQSNKHLLEANMESISKMSKLEKEIEELKKEKKWCEEALQDTQTTFVKIDADRTNLQEAFDKVSGENRGLNARIDCLRLEVNGYRKHFKEQSDKILGLKSRLNSMCGDEYLNKLLDSTRNDGYEQGQKDLWDKLQEVSDYYYFGGDDEFDTDDCEMTSMTDIIDNLNADQFLEAYENWHKAQEQHRLDRMRDWLHDFCANRFCEGCPLASNEYKCGRGYSFAGAKPIPDEDIKRYYEKARACSKPLSHWTCTLEGTINAEIDKDLLKKVCGIDSDD